ncbi:MAG: phosphatase PAP2 family protein, partial [Verrucomicrobiales bacterium]|nr:phosphatase PAP2 family protein [Verrucomicrobiales bacterium]
MASRKKKNEAGGLIIGPALVIIALVALWKNETRFDYHKAAAKTEPAFSLDAVGEGSNFSYTGGMDGSLTLPGKYIAAFTGYLRSAGDKHYLTDILVGAVVGASTGLAITHNRSQQVKKEK